MRAAAAAASQPAWPPPITTTSNSRIIRASESRLVAEARGGVKKSRVFGEMFHVKHRPSEYRRTQVTPDSRRQKRQFGQNSRLPGTELGRVLARASIQAAMSSRASLFADAEVAEDHVQNILDIDPAGQPPERMGGDAQLFGQQILAGRRRRPARARCRAARTSRSAWRWRSRVISADSAPRQKVSAWRARCAKRGSKPSPVTAERLNSIHYY